MPICKGSFATFPAYSGDIINIAARLRNVDFEFGEGIKCIAADRNRTWIAGAAAVLECEIVQRKAVETIKYDDAESKLLTVKTVREKVNTFRYDPATGIAETAGSFRDFAIFAEAMQRSGAGKDFEPRPMLVDMLAWVQAVVAMYPTAQLGRVVVDNLYVEPRCIGQYSAKTVDNRLDMAYLETVAGQIRSIKLAFFDEGCRCSIEATAKATLTVTSSDEEDVDHLFIEQRAVMLEHSTGGE